MQKNYAVIVLGLGETPSLYRFLVRNWQKQYGVTPVIHVVGWKKKAERFEPKLARLVSKVEALAKDGNRVTLIGISAGASASVNAQTVLKKKHIHVPVYTICGRFNLDHHWWYPLSYGVRRMPAFEESVRMVMPSIRRLRGQNPEDISCFRAVFDEVVPRSASVLPGAEMRPIPIPSHHLAIYFRLLFPEALIMPLKMTLAQ